MIEDWGNPPVITPTSMAVVFLMNSWKSNWFDSSSLSICGSKNLKTSTHYAAINICLEKTLLPTGEPSQPSQPSRWDSTLGREVWWSSTWTWEWIEMRYAAPPCSWTDKVFSFLDWWWQIIVSRPHSWLNFLELEKPTLAWQFRNDSMIIIYTSWLVGVQVRIGFAPAWDQCSHFKWTGYGMILW